MEDESRLLSQKFEIFLKIISILLKQNLIKCNKNNFQVPRRNDKGGISHSENFPYFCISHLLETKTYIFEIHMEEYRAETCLNFENQLESVLNKKTPRENCMYERFHDESSPLCLCVLTASSRIDRDHLLVFNITQKDHTKYEIK